MLTFGRASVPILALLAIALFLPAGRADVVVLKDGRSFEGKIIRETDGPEGKVVIDAMIAGIRTQMPVAKDDIETITRKDVPADFYNTQAARAPAVPAPPRRPAPAPGPGAPGAPAGPTTAPDDPPPAEPKDFTGTGYLEIPLSGVFGRNIFPEGVADALAYADEHPAIKHIVFTLDSDGGEIWAADKILAYMIQYKKRFTYHVIITKAISASIWVVFACDSIHMTDGSTVGGAVVYQANEFGNTQVNAKMNSIICAKIEAEADTKGRFSKLIQPMMLLGTTAAAWSNEEGKVCLAPRLPAGVDPEKIIFENTPTNILTLTKDKAVQVGLARPFQGQASDLGKDLGIADWAKYNAYGEWAVRRARVRDEPVAVDGLKRVTNLLSKLKLDLDEAVQTDPNQNLRQFAAVMSGGSVIFTPTSRAEWVRRSDRSIAAYQRVEDAIVEFRKMQDQRNKLGLPTISLSVNLDDFYDRADRDLKELRANRNRQGP